MRVLVSLWAGRAALAGAVGLPLVAAILVVLGHSSAAAAVAYLSLSCLGALVFLKSRWLAREIRRGVPNPGSTLRTVRQQLRALELGQSDVREALASQAVLADRNVRALQLRFDAQRASLERLAQEADEYRTMRELLVPGAFDLPPSGGWALTTPTIVHMVHHVLEDPSVQTVVELGSGVSTLWLALAMRKRGTGHIHSFDHEEKFAAITRANVARFGVEEYVTVHTSPLVPCVIEGREYLWYDVSSLPAYLTVDLLFVDGPPEDTGTDARFPALPQLAPRLAPGAWVVLDDTIRAGERAILARWQTDPSLRLGAGQQPLGKSTLVIVEE